jgi:hypothetical protein
MVLSKRQQHPRRNMADTIESEEEEGIWQRKTQNNALLVFLILIGGAAIFGAKRRNSVLDLGATKSMQKAILSSNVSMSQVIKVLDLPNAADFPYCRSRNKVIDRDAKNIDDEKVRNRSLRPFSMQEKDFMLHHEHNCASLEEHLAAVKYGRRHWAFNFAGMTQSQREWEEPSHPSWFVPHKCNIPIASSVDLCNTINRFSHIILMGDSLGRHVQEGLFIALSNDFVTARGTLFASVDSQEKCQCDGIFSEHEVCRMNSPMLSKVQPHGHAGLCPRIITKEDDTLHTTVQLTRHSYAFSEGPAMFLKTNFTHVQCDAETKPVVLSLQAGLHFNSDPVKAHRFMAPLLNHPAIRECARLGKLLLIWHSFESQARQVDQNYPRQSREKGEAFNANLRGILRSEFELVKNNVTFIDWMNLTAGAQTSDGVHHLMNANYYKAHYLVSIAMQMLEEERFTRLAP